MINTFYYENNLCGLKRSDFQRTIDGKDVDLFILKNDNGAEMAITNYGGALLAIMVPDKDGNLANVIQGHDRYLSKDGEEGFPGNLNIQVIYTFTNQNEFILTYTATTDRTTLVNLTHHAFFSLSGIANPTPSVENNILTINADFYTPIDEVSIPTGEILKVADTPMDFRTPHTVGSRINEPFQQLINGTGYDHNYVLNKEEASTLTFAAKCVEPESGRSLEVYTTEPGVQVYTANWQSGFSGWHGATFPARSAICFEAQHFPDTPNKGHFPSAVLNPGETYHQVTVYKFGVEK